MFAWLFYGFLIVLDGGFSIAAVRRGGVEANPFIRNPYVHVGVKVAGLPVLVKIDRWIGRRSKKVQWIGRGLVVGITAVAVTKSVRESW